MNNEFNVQDLRITALHEAAHAVVARLLGIPINWITLEYMKQYQRWNGSHNGYFEFDPSFIPDRIWDNLHLENKIPYDELQFEYPTYPEPYQEYKQVRDRCTIDYAGLIAQRLFYAQIGQADSTKIAEGCSNDIDRATNRVWEQFQEQEIREKELIYAENHAERILNNTVAWKIIEDLANYMLDTIISRRKDAEEDGLCSVYRFVRQEIYRCFERSLTSTGDNLW